MKVKGVAFIGGPLGISLMIALSVGIGRLMGWTLPESVAIGAALCVASTMVMSRLLMDQGALQSPHGHVMIGITLIEDFAVILLTVLLPELAGSAPEHRLATLAMDIGKAFLILGPVVYLAIKWVPRLMARIERIRNVELSVLMVLAIGLATAAVTQALGLSLALGAFLGGMIISDSDIAEDTLSHVQPFRDAFVALFFVTVGALIDPRALVASPGLLALFVAMIMLGKLAIWTCLVRLFGYPMRTALLVGVGLTQIGEFSYVLIQVARRAGLVDGRVYNAVLAASLLTILLNAGLLKWVTRGFARDS